ncbi:bifunctional 5,10-methylenetetrahydrofolate dehydrogenase/5,10-methenyltetrahydrofolate cyclohydrolase [Candidatus Bathyarchaeota archaeon]|nr:bifunctional 5,10-methylenetetrahydrofolate dehydrogenase/5,10-methenyltetrahydrofolate cyclohydrolase [Candidatus Bathyarchaeota archaeon]
MVLILDGRETSAKILEEIKADITTLKTKGITPNLHLILIGTDQNSLRYINMKIKRAEEAGITAMLHHYEKTTTDEIVRLIKELNSDPKVHGIMIQLPVPNDIKEHEIVEAILPEKDVDGLGALTFGKILMGQKAFLPAGVDAVMQLLERYNIQWESKHWVVVGLTAWLGKPLVAHLLNKKVQVTALSADESNIESYAKQADVLVVEVYKKHVINASMIKDGVVIIDNGNNYEGKKVFGDVNTEDVSKLASAITPVPGGTGPLLISMLIKNTVEAAKKLS